MNRSRIPDAEPIPGYRLVEPLGSGGFGEVWKCEAPGGLNKAIKFVYGNLNSLDVDAARAEQELQALERIKEVRHPFVCSLDRIEVTGGELVIVMELCDKTLHDVYKEFQSAGLIGIPRDNLLRYLRDAAEALDYMNEKHKLQHLDVKPRNLFLVSDRVKVADFGLVKHLERLSSSGLLGGVTPLYAPPETFDGKISETSDQYSLAIVYQEMLTGHRPYTGKNSRQIAQQHLQAQPDLRALPVAERAVVGKALSKNPTERFPTCIAFISALYKARTPIAVTQPDREPALAGAVERPRSIADTLEEIFLNESIDAPDYDDLLPSMPPPPDDLQNSDLEVSNLGVTVAQPDTGALRPTLFIGIGGFGRKGMLELRCRLVDRFGDLNKIPALKFICLESDPEAVNTAVRGAPEVALSRQEVHHLPLQAVSNYRRRSIDQLTDWLPREKLYAMPRSLQPMGSRALGRLAFVDNYQRLQARLRREIQEITNPDVIYQTVNQTGLALRNSTPRICIIASAGGGGSGMLADLGYALRRQLAHLRHPDADVSYFLLCSAPTDPASPQYELANVYATLTELNHYSDPSIPFAAEYGAEGQRIIDQGMPAAAIYLLPLPHRGSDAAEDAVAHLGSYLFHESTTSLGAHLGNLRSRDPAGSAANDAFATPFRSFGTYAVWFPRGLLLRLAARMASRKIIGTWLESDETAVAAPVSSPEIKAVCEEVFADPQLRREELEERILEATRDARLNDLDATPAEAVTAVLATLQEQSLQLVAQEDPGGWVRQAINRVRDWVGGVSAMEVQSWRKTRVNRALHFAAKSVAEEYAETLSGCLGKVMEQTGARIAAAEKTVDRLEKFSAEQADHEIKQMAGLQQRTVDAWKQVELVLAEFSDDDKGFRWFGGRSNRRLLQGFMEQLSTFARARLQEDTAGAVHHFFGALGGQLEELRRDLGFCRQRLRHLQENLDNPQVNVDEDMTNTKPGSGLTLTRSPVASTEGYWEAIRQSSTARVLLPENEDDLERAAVQLLQRLSIQDWDQLDKELHERVLESRGGLYGACMQSGDLTRGLAVPLMQETISLLDQHLPVMDVAQIMAAEFGITFDENQLLSKVPNSRELADNLKEYLARATPFLSRSSGNRVSSFLLVPASTAGQGLSRAMTGALPELCHVKVPGQADLMFCRDQGPVPTDNLREIFQACGKAYTETAASPLSSPHCRFDILDWIPLDP